MVKQVSFRIMAEPIGKERPRASYRNGFATIYTPKKTKVYEKLVADTFKKEFPNHEPINSECSVIITSYLKIPKSYSKKKKEEILRKDSRPLSKPDIDNMAKSILDGLNGVAYSDDTLITDLWVGKKYAGTEPHSDVVITWNEEAYR